METKHQRRSFGNVPASGAFGLVGWRGEGARLGAFCEPANTSCGSLTTWAGAGSANVLRLAQQPGVSVVPSLDLEPKTPPMKLGIIEVRRLFLARSEPRAD